MEPGREPSFKGQYAAFWRKCWMKKKRAYDIKKRREERLRLLDLKKEECENKKINV